ncbi:uncharacterized protein LOC132197732 [Neocloeon triangulifer]|uniref:uncharacterized protein LOC132197732 n=1 Tax=Neocloeon triangulifer TaxID=2078957 RepID=UPI00286F46FD|nr:uncharacterized protein LOC132197732 [Neocloeon triangulifer]
MRTARTLLAQPPATQPTSTVEPDFTAAGNGSSTNSTGGFFVDNENEDGAGLSEAQTVMLALLATLVPLLLIVIIVFTARVVWRKFGAGSEDGALRRAESSEPNAAKSAASMGHLLPEELKASESQSTVTPSVDELSETPKSPLLSSSQRVSTSGPPSVAAQPLSHHQASAKSANGSIITLTMQNNHLIVETETTGEDLVTSSDAASADSVTLEVGGVSELAAQIHAPPSPPCFTGLSVSSSSLSGPPSYCYSTQTAYGVTPLCQPITKPLLEANNRHAIDDPNHISAKILRRRLHSAYSQVLDDADFAPNHHRTASLPPIKLTRTNTVVSEAPPAEPPAVAPPRGAGKFKARASLPCINAPILSKIFGDKPASIAE